MANFPPLSFSGAATWKPYDGGAHGLVSQEGVYQVQVKALEPILDKSGTKGMVKIDCVIQDADQKNIPLIDRVLYSGVDFKGNPLARQFWSFMASTGTPVATINQLGTQNASTDINGALPQLLNRMAYAEVKYTVYEGQLQCEVANWLSPEAYAKKKEQNGLRGLKIEQVDIKTLASSMQNASTGSTFTAPAGTVVPAAPNLGGPGLNGIPAGAPAGASAAAPNIPQL